MLKSHLEVIDQAISLLNELDHNSFTQVLSPYFSGSIGQHLRHVIDHYENLFDGLAEGFVNYNQRKRFCSVEKSLEACSQALYNIRSKINALTTTQLSEALSILTEISISEQDDALVASNVERELVFASFHAIHHYALIKIIRQMQHATVPPEFGYAPATLTYLRTQNVG